MKPGTTINPVALWSTTPPSAPPYAPWLPDIWQDTSVNPYIISQDELGSYI